MMIGETHHYIPPWQDSNNHPTVQITSSPPSSLLSLQSNVPNQLPNSPTYYDAVLASLRCYLDEKESPKSLDCEDFDFVAEDYDDDFFMYDFKVKKCVRARAHDWTECPFAHPGEKARRRDPRKYNYSGTSCSEFRKGGCKRGDICEFAHGVFECWLHPARFRTQACKDGPGCKRRVCFFAHTPDQLRIAPGLGSPRGSGYLSGSEDGAITPATNSPKTIGELVASLKNLQLNKVKSMGNATPHASMMGGSLIYGSPDSPRSVLGPTAVSRAGFFSMPTTPTRPRIGYWDNPEFTDIEDPPVLERVESGRELRVRMFEKLSKENPLEGSSSPLSIPNPGPGPDLGWVSDLIEY